MSEQFWWKDRAWRIVQTNLREIDMADMDAAQYVRELQDFHANTVIMQSAVTNGHWCGGKRPQCGASAVGLS